MKYFYCLHLPYFHIMITPKKEYYFVIIISVKKILLNPFVNKRHFAQWLLGMLPIEGRLHDGAMTR